MNGKRYTPKEDSIILNKRNKIEDIAKKLGRSVASIQNRRIMLRYKKAKLEELGLTLMEDRVLRRVVNGVQNSEISEEFDLSIRTVETHRRNIMLKLNAKNFFNAIKIAYDKGILEPKK